jgi:hypothetical protein
MAGLSDRIENMLNEAQMLLLGGQVLLGFSYRDFLSRALIESPNQPSCTTEWSRHHDRRTWLATITAMCSG